MFLTQSNEIRHLSKEEYSMLDEMCRYSNNLYNVALYNIRQRYFRERGFLDYEENCHKCKDNENFALLQSHVAQQTLRAADRSFKSFSALIKKAKKGEYKFQDIKMPHYRKKGDMFVLILPASDVRIKDGFLKVPMSRAFSNLHEGKSIMIPFPERLAGKKIREVRIVPVFNGQSFKIQYVYEQQEQTLPISQDKTLAIDIGLENLATCITTIGTSFIIDGRKLKSINQYWNKRRARLQSIANRQGVKSTSLMKRITTKRNNCAKDYIRKAARYIVDYCIEHGIGTIVCGYNGDFKRNINLGKVTNQQFAQISFGSLREQLASLCEQYGIQYIEQEESYTSKASCLDMDNIPVYDPEQPYEGSFSGKRVHRGLYRCSDGRTVNADLNGAANILRKNKQDLDLEELRRGLLVSPSRIRVA